MTENNPIRRFQTLFQVFLAERKADYKRWKAKLAKLTWGALFGLVSLIAGALLSLLLPEVIIPGKWSFTFISFTYLLFWIIASALCLSAQHNIRIDQARKLPDRLRTAEMEFSVDLGSWRGLGKGIEIRSPPKTPEQVEVVELVGAAREVATSARIRYTLFSIFATCMVLIVLLMFMSTLPKYDDTSWHYEEVTASIFSAYLFFAGYLSVYAYVEPLFEAQVVLWQRRVGVKVKKTLNVWELHKNRAKIHE